MAGRKAPSDRAASKGEGAKFDYVMHEWKEGKLHSGSKTGPKVPKGKAGQKRALAIAFSQQRKENAQ
jgi:hypothetical protein